MPHASRSNQFFNPAAGKRHVYILYLRLSVCIRVYRIRVYICVYLCMCACDVSDDEDLIRQQVEETFARIIIIYIQRWWYCC